MKEQTATPELPKTLQDAEEALTLLSRNRVGGRWMQSDATLVKDALAAIQASRQQAEPNRPEPVEVAHTGRGFSKIEFTDRYDVACSLQKSSLAFEDAIWLGCNDANPRKLIPGKGWLPVEMPTEYIADTRMHLTSEQVAWLLPILQQFVATGEVAAPPAQAQQQKSIEDDDRLARLMDSQYRAGYKAGRIARSKEEEDTLKHNQEAAHAVGVEQDKVDAERWRALIGSARIRVLGSAGLTSELNPYGAPWNGYAHIGVELWTKHECAEENALGIEWLTKYTDIAARAAKEKANG